MAEVELPDEVIVEILSFLPVKSLLRFRLVCRSWLNLISSPKFKLMHLRNFNQLNPRYFVRRIDYDEDEELYNVRYDDEAFGLDIGTDIEFPFDRIRVGYRIVGCCNGVVCLSDDDDSSEGEFYLDDGIILWNPSIRRKLTLPLPMSYSYGLRYPSAPFLVFGFGYDNISDDFKVVCLAYDECYPTRSRPKVEVYTVKTGIWRKVVFPGDLRCFNIQPAWSQIFSNGCVHWICTFDSNWSRYSILTFDVTTELFGEIRLPDFLEQTHFLKISAVGESLAVIHTFPINFDGLRSTESTYVVMVMKEYKNPTSWTTLYHTHYPDLDFGQPLRVRNNGYMVVQFKNRDIIMFNHDEGRYVCVLRVDEDEKKGCSDYKTYVDRYEESLALLEVGDSVPNKEAMEALMMIENQAFQMRSRWKQMRRAMEARMMIEKQGYESKMDCRTYVDKYQESLTLLDGGHNVLNDEAINALMRIEKQEIEIEIEMAAVELPDELIVQILTFLPAKSLLRFRLVCKSWLNLINSTEFKLMHLHNFNHLNPRYFIRRLDNYVDEEWFCVHFDDEDFTFDSGTQIELPFDSVYLCFWIVDCCNGVVCLCDYDEFNEYGFTLERIILWNPSIRRKLTLPLPIFYSVGGFEDPYVVFGFGYDKISDDYKVVCLTYDEDEDSNITRPKAEVYTVKTGIWREVMFPHNLRYSSIRSKWSRIFFNGCVHWIASDSNWSHYSIMTFDVTTELFGEIQLPGFLAQEHSLKVSVVGESLALIDSSGISFDGLKSRGSTYIVMVMKEHKNPSSWTMLYHIHYPDLDVGKPLRLRNNSDMVVELENRDMIMFNHDEFSYMYVFRDGEEEEDFDYKTYVDRYVESLALLDVGDSVPNKEAVKALMMIEKQGFGYDKISDDYKVVTLEYNGSSSNRRPQVKVYTLKTGIWREVMFPHNLVCYFTFPSWLQVFFNGSVHWTACDPTPGGSRYSIMTFDITTELSGEIQFPEFLAEEFLMVSVVGESLAVTHSSDLNFDGLESGSTYMVWVMKEYKNPASWTMLYYMHYSEVGLGKPLRLRNNGDMIVELEDRDTIILGHWMARLRVVIRFGEISNLGHRDLVPWCHDGAPLHQHCRSKERYRPGHQGNNSV
ncbi:hypothetical protein OSB04_013419 [Centaurea solstitialis]|uniref:F-box domain-containing protein n=1 Tax=Centaurea solstitialis TaxID=347529 RepID=A0AA38TPX7_9ASTR|nr:hypothetical protein OSB04_013419 [Centaurea solstitialis]